MQAGAGLPALVQGLRSRRKATQAQAAAALADLAEEGGSQRCEQLAAAGAVGPLLQLVRSGGSALVQRQAAWALAILAVGSDSVLAMVAEAGGVQAAVPLLHSDNSDVQQGACALLASLASCGLTTCEAIVGADALSALVRLCGGSSAVPATSVLRHLSAHQSCQAAVVAAGAIELLASLIFRISCSSSGDSGDDGGDLAIAGAVRALACLAGSGRDRHAAVVAAGLPAALVRLLGSPDEELREEAVYALNTLVDADCPEARAATAAAGGIAALAGLLASGGSDSSGCASHRHHAAVILHSLADGSPERCAAIVSAGCIPHLLRMLSSSAGEGERRAAAGTLAEVAMSGGHSTSEALAAAGGATALESYLRTSQCQKEVLAVAGALGVMAVRGHCSTEQAANALGALQGLSESSDQGLREAAARTRHGLLAAMEASAEETSATAATAAAATAAATAAAATAAIPAEATAVATPVDRQRPPRVCAAPGCSATSGLRRCGGCGAVRYCSEACSRAHWRAHKVECRCLQAERAAQASDSGAGHSSP